MFAIPDSMLDEIVLQAEREYPRECCGMIFGTASSDSQITRLRPCQNAYDRYHEMDPQNFPRTSKTAYFIDPKELLEIQKELRARNEEIRIIYHSHIDAGAYFSEEDFKVATSEGEPVYPGVQYLVVSVRAGKAGEMNLYGWNDTRKEYLA